MSICNRCKTPCSLIETGLIVQSCAVLAKQDAIDPQAKQDAAIKAAIQDTIREAKKERNNTE